MLPFNGQGWFSHAQAMPIVMEEAHAKVVVELGSWLGLSTRFIASHLPKDGVLYAVDHWCDSEYLSTLPSEYSAYDLSKLYQQFLSNVIHAHLTDIIVPLRMSTAKALPILIKKQVRPDLIYIDAGHDEKSVYEDVSGYFPLVKGHGIMCGDDWNWPTVSASVTRYAKEHNLAIQVLGNLWVYRERAFVSQ